MTMSLAGMAGLVVFGWIVLASAVQIFKGGFFTTAAAGVGVLVLIATISDSALIVVNPATACTAAILGAPGVVGMLLTKLITFI